MATAIQIIVAGMALCGLGYGLLALWSARDFSREGSRAARHVSAFTPDVSILKPVKGVDARMYAGFVSHCNQKYAGRFEILFGVSTLDDPAVTEVRRLQAEFLECDIRLIVCPEKLGTSGKVSNLVQMLRQAKYEHYIVNDSDILVSPHYLTNILREFAPAAENKKPVGLVTAPYIGRTSDDRKQRTVWSKLEALGIATEFFPGVLTARKIEGGLHFGLGSTLAFTRQAIHSIGGLEPLVDYLADDYQLGARIAAAGQRVVLSREVVETTVPRYSFRQFWEHQMRWACTMNDARKSSYAGVVFMYGLAWAIFAVIASAGALWSFTLLSMVLLVRVAVALSVGVGLLRDGQVLRDLWLLPVRDCLSLFLWAWSYADNVIVWRGERFRLKDGKLHPL